MLTLRVALVGTMTLALLAGSSVGSAMAQVDELPTYGTTAGAPMHDEDTERGATACGPA